MKKILILLATTVISLLFFGRSLAASDFGVAVTMPHIIDSQKYVLVNKPNPFKFGVCAPSTNKPSHDKMIVKFVTIVGGTSADEIGRDSRSGYQTPRSPAESCTNGVFYNDKVVINYAPTATGKIDLQAKYFDPDDETKVLGMSEEFSVQIVDELPPGEDTGSEGGGGGGGATDTGISNILNLGNLSDIFKDSGIGTHLTEPEMLFNKVLEILLQIAGVLALIAFVWSGYTYLLSGGDTAKAEKGRKGIVWAVTGIILIIFAYTIVRAVNIFQSPTSEIPEVKY